MFFESESRNDLSVVDGIRVSDLNLLELMTYRKFVFLVDSDALIGAALVSASFDLRDSDTLSEALLLHYQ